MSKSTRLIVCVNDRLGSGQRSCVGSGNLDLIRKIQRMLDEQRLDVAVIRRECLGRCEEGPIMRIAPGGPYFTEIDEPGLAHIIEELKIFVIANNGTEL